MGPAMINGLPPLPPPVAPVGSQAVGAKADRDPQRVRPETSQAVDATNEQAATRSRQPEQRGALLDIVV